MALPVIGANLAGKAATGFRWFVTPLDQLVAPGEPRGLGAELTRTIGAATELRVRREGLYALVVLGYERRGGADPFEFRVEAAPGDLLDFEQYEFLMNLLALRAPAGVEINTWPIRRFHVASESGAQTPLDPSASRTYRPFHRPRRAGAPPAPAGDS